MNNEYENKVKYVSWSRIFREYRAKWALILIASIVIGILVAGASFVNDRRHIGSPVYYSRMSIYMEGEDPSTGKYLAGTYAQILTSDSVVSELEKKTTDMTPDMIKRSIYFSQVTGTKIFSVYAVTNSEENTKAIINGLKAYGIPAIAATDTGATRIIAGPTDPEKKHAEAGQGVSTIFDNPITKYNFTDWDVYTAGIGGKRALVKKGIAGFGAGLILCLIVGFIHAVVTRKVRYREDLMDCAFITDAEKGGGRASEKIASRLFSREEGKVISIDLSPAVSKDAAAKIANDVAGQIAGEGYRVILVSDAGEHGAGYEVLAQSAVDAKSYAEKIGTMLGDADYIVQDLSSAGSEIKKMAEKNLSDKTVFLAKKGKTHIEEVQTAKADTEGRDAAFIGTILC